MRIDPIGVHEFLRLEEPMEQKAHEHAFVVRLTTGHRAQDDRVDRLRRRENQLFARERHRAASSSCASGASRSPAHGASNGLGGALGLRTIAASSPRRSR